MILYTTIILYILSVIIGLFLMASVKTISKRKIAVGITLHILLLFFYCISKWKTADESHASYNNYFFLFFICSGIILAGLAWRSSVFLAVKIYFSLFALTIALFVFSPSRLMVFLLTSKYSDTLGKTFIIRENYFLEEQNTSTGLPSYKLVLKHGLFHETIQRDLVFKGTLDSIRVLKFTPKEMTIIRGYSGTTTYVSIDLDSIDKEVSLVKTKVNQIEKRF